MPSFLKLIGPHNASSAVFLFYLKPKHLFSCYSYLAEIYKRRGRCLAKTASLVILNKRPKY